MKLENMKAQMRKGILELCILSIIAEKEAYPSDILGKLKEAKLIVVEGTLYPMLSRMKNSGILGYNWKESTSGPPRKYYHLTIEGTDFLSELNGLWKNLARSVTKTTTKRKTTTTKRTSSTTTKNAS